jgi:hypothetical protein
MTNHLRIVIPLNEGPEVLFSKWIDELSNFYEVLIIVDSYKDRDLLKRLREKFLRVQFINVPTPHPPYAESFFGDFLECTEPKWNLRIDADETVDLNELLELSNYLEYLDVRYGYTVERLFMVSLIKAPLAIYQERFKSNSRVDPNLRLFHSNHAWKRKQVHSTGIRTSRETELLGLSFKIRHWAPLFRSEETREINYKNFNLLGNFEGNSFREGYDLNMRFENKILKMGFREWELVADRLRVNE